MGKSFLNRRGFLFSVVAAPFALLSAIAKAAKKTVVTTQAEAEKALVKPTEAMPAALKYSEKASKAPLRTNVKSKCSNCLQYAQAMTKDGKEIKSGGEPIGSCALFNTGKGFVRSEGWCMSWFEAPAA